jgi:hypothetical protein
LPVDIPLSDEEKARARGPGAGCAVFGLGRRRSSGARFQPESQEVGERRTGTSFADEVRREELLNITLQDELPAAGECLAAIERAGHAFAEPAGAGVVSETKTRHGDETSPCRE